MMEEPRSSPSPTPSPRRVSHSEFKTFRRCPRQWWLHYVRKLSPPRVSTGALSLGSLTHVGMEYLYEGGELENAMDAIRDKALEVLPQAEDPEAWMKQAADAQNFVVGYHEWLRETGADQRYEHVASEEELEMPLHVMEDGVPWVLIGKLDRRVLDRETGRVRYMDFKTTARFDDIIEQAPRNEQFPTYDLLMRHNYGETVGGGIWRMILKLKRAKDGDKEFFRDYEASFNDQFLESVRRRYVAMATQMHGMELTLTERPELHQFFAYPTPQFSCSWDCDFKIVCDMFDDGSRAEDALRSMYVNTDPYERYVTIGRNKE